MARPAGISVQVGRVGMKLQEVMLGSGNQTVDDALEAAGIDLKDEESIRVNGEDHVNGDDVDGDTILDNHDVVLLVKSIDGGR